MSDDPRRSVQLTRLSQGVYQATNSRGGTLVFSSVGSDAFTPVELLLAAIAGCTAIDVDLIVSKRAEPSRFDVSMTANKVRDDDGNHLVDLAMRLGVTFPEGDDGDAARDVLPMAVTRSHERLCTVGRTIEIGAPIHVTTDLP